MFSAQMAFDEANAFEGRKKEDTFRSLNPRELWRKITRKKASKDKSPSSTPLLSPWVDVDDTIGSITTNEAIVMSSNRLLSVSSGPAAYKQRAIQEADQQQRAMDDRIAKLGMAPSKYRFRELIGKGTYGRVYKSTHIETGKIVAVKVLETDAIDFQAEAQNKDGGMEDAMKEINILRRLQQSKAVNVNQFHEAFQVHSQLWIVNDYCSGGSLSTLRRATGNKFDEKYLVAIARELAAGLRSVHEAGIIHRDIKCANVMIDETGKLQIIDFGVAGILLSNLDVDKRKTVIGTPHWMAPELQSTAMEIAHGTEVDVWAFGITMYECSTGAPPNARVLPGRQLRSQIKQNPAPRLPETFSTGLQDLVECVLEPDPKARPSMEEICEHSYIKNTEAMHPTIILRELVETYYQWETQGGQRASLFFPGGAAQPKLGGGQIDDEEEWNFSTTANFEQIHADLDTALGLNNQTGDSQFNFLSSSPPRDPDDYPGQAMQRGLEPAKRPGSSKGQTDAENEQSIARGARHMQGLFDNTAPQYSYNYGNTHGSSSDLPLRTGDSSSSLHRKELSVSSQSGGAPQINLDSITSKKGKRGTMAWKWEDNLGENDGTFPQEPPAQPPVRPVLKHAATMPAEPFNARPVSEGLLDLDAMMDEPIYATLPTNTPYASTTDPSATLDANPPPEDDEGEMGYTMRPSVPTVPSNLPTARRAHQPVSSISSFLSVEDATDGTLHPPLPSTHHWGPPSTTTSTRASVNFPPPIPPAALANDAPFEVMHDAFTQVMTGWLGMLEMNLQALGVSDDEETDSEDEYGVETETGNGNGVAEEENGVGNDWSEAGFAAGSGASREVSSEEEGDEE